MTTGYLTTHVLDTARGQPAAGIKIALYRVSGNSHRKVAEDETNADGLCGDNVKFLDQIPIRFGVSDEAMHYHVPLLLSPYGYSTYRGS